MSTNWIAPKPDTEDLFWYFVAERQKVWHNRYVKKLPQPWTDDAVIANARFTNVFRELDRGTQFCVEQIMESPYMSSFREIIFHTLAYRWFNRIETYVNLILPNCKMGQEPDWEAILIAMLIAKGRGEKLYTGAYIATYCPDMGNDGDKVMDSLQVLQELWRMSDNLIDLRRRRAAKMINMVTALREEVKGVGPFIAYQCTLDWTYPLKRFNGACIMPDVDVNSWSQPGPGAIKGLNLMGVSGGLPSQLRAMMALNDKAQSVLQDIDWYPPVSAGGYPIPMTLANIEHSLCEFQKYYRMVGGGTVKTVWKQSTATAWKPAHIMLPAWEDARWKPNQPLIK